MNKNTLVLRDNLSLYIREISRHKLLTQKEELFLAEEWFYKKDKTAAEKLVLSNLRFVVKVAYKFKNYKMKLEDLIQEGNIGLIRAVQTYDPNQDVRLIHYASWWIKSKIQAYILKMWNIVKIGTTQAQRKLFFKLRQTESKILMENKETEGLSQRIAKELNLKVKEVEEMQVRISGAESSIDKPLNNSKESSSFSDYLPAKINIEEDFINRKIYQENKKKLKKALKLLNEREADILNRRFFNDKKESYKEIGEFYGISKQRVAQIEKSAIAKMKKLF